MKQLLIFFSLIFSLTMQAQVEDWQLEFAPDSNYIKVSDTAGQFTTVRALDWIKNIETATHISYDTTTYILTYQTESGVTQTSDFSSLALPSGGTSGWVLSTDGAGNYSWVEPYHIRGTFLNDADAGANGCPVGGLYELDVENTHGESVGSLRIRKF